jgi:uncharacterized protein
MSARASIAVVVSLMLVAGGCAGSDAPAETRGACADVYGGQVCTWEKVGGSSLLEVGATIPLASIEHAPAEMPMVWPPVPSAAIDLPAATRQQTRLTHLTVDWNAAGHPPGAFMTPHFDFHYYAIPASEVAAIDCKDDGKPAVLPAAYGLPDIPLPPEMAGMMGVSTLVGLCVPKMGMHAMPQSEIDRLDPFGGTMVVGYYKGKPIFIEPMISKAMLMKEASFELPVPEVAGFAGPVPTKFRAEYDPAARSYRFVLSGFTPAS